MAATAKDELLSMAALTACEAVRARDAVLELRCAADSMADGALANGDAIKQVAKAYGIPVRHRQMKHIALNLADVLLEDVSNAGTQTCRTVLAFADGKDLRSWEARGVLPRGAYQEAARSVWVARDPGSDDGAMAAQLERCKLALAYPARLVAHIATAALAGDASPMLGAFSR